MEGGNAIELELTGSLETNSILIEGLKTQNTSI